MAGVRISISPSGDLVRVQLINPVLQPWRPNYIGTSLHPVSSRRKLFLLFTDNKRFFLPLKNGYPHYLPLSRYWQTGPRRGREVSHYFHQIIVRLTFCSLFLKDAGLDYKDVRYPYDNTWAETSKKLRERGLTRTGQLPTLEYGGSVITQVR